MTATVIGPPGGGGGGGDKFFPFEQLAPATTWIINHGLNKKPSVTTTSLADKRVNGSVTYLSLNALQIDFTTPFSGRAYLN